MDHLQQLKRWGQKGYAVRLLNEHGNGWVCTVSNVEEWRAALAPNVADGAPRIRAMSAVCDAPEKAIEDLLMVVQP